MPPEPVEQVEQIKFDDAVEMGLRFVSNIKLNEWELGALADRVEPKYGKATLKRFAEELGVPYETLRKYRYVYRKFRGKHIGDNFPFLACSPSLAGVEDGPELIQANPEMTTTEARKVASERSTKKGKQKKLGETRNTPGWYRDAVEHTKKANSKYGYAKPEDFDATFCAQSSRIQKRR